MLHPRRINAAEPLNRFLFNKQEFGTQPRRVTHHAFMPNRNRTTGRLEKSVHRINGLSSSEIWRLGRLFVEQGRALKARASGQSTQAMQAGLRFAIGGSPWPRHADIVEWPMEKSEQKLLAMQIAVAFVLEEASR